MNIFHIIHQFQDAANGTHAVRYSAGSASFLSNNAVAQRDFFIQFAHRVFADADVRHDKINVAERHFRIGGVTKRNVRRSLFKDDFTGFSNHFLPRTIVIIKFQCTKRETVLIRQEHQHDAWRKGASTACDNH